jgi:hypothetical protein
MRTKIAVAALLLAAVACSKNNDAVSATAGGVSRPSTPSATATALPSMPATMGETRMEGRYVGKATVTDTNVDAFKHSSQKQDWSITPQCPTGVCSVTLVSESGNYTTTLTLKDGVYKGTVSRKDLWTCQGKKIGGLTKLTVTPMVPAPVDGQWVVAAAQAENYTVSVGGNCKRAFFRTQATITLKKAG